MKLPSNSPAFKRSSASFPVTDGAQRMRCFSCGGWRWAPGTDIARDADAVRVATMLSGEALDVAAIRVAACR